MNMTQTENPGKGFGLVCWESCFIFPFLFIKSSVSLTFCSLRLFSQQDFFFSSAKHTNVNVELDTFPYVFMFPNVFIP